MQAILDNLAALLVVGVVGIMIAEFGLTRAEGSRDGVRFYAHQNSQTSFIEMVERDLTVTGVQAPSDVVPIQTATPDRFTFYGLVDEDTAGLVDYRRIPVSTADNQTVYRIERWANGARTGASPDRVIRFVITPLAADGVTVVTASEARALRAEIEWILPIGSDDAEAARQAMRRSAWSTVILPIALQR